MPFSSRKDAEMAEAIAIHIAALAELHISSDNKETNKIITQATNRVGMKGTKHLVPAVFRKDGSNVFGTLKWTAIVVLKPESIDARGSLHGGRPVARLLREQRASGTWKKQGGRVIGLSGFW
jgi:hypothetical protein